MQFDEIMATLKTVKTIPQTPLTQKIVNAIQCSNAQIKNTFFNSLPAAGYLNYHSQDAQAALDELATKYLTFVISRSTAMGFNATTCNISYETINQWFSINGPTLGLWMMMDYMLNDKGLAPIMTNTEESRAMLVGKGKDPIFVNGFLVECDTAGTNLPPKLFLNVMNILDPSGNDLRTVLPIWQSQERWPTVKDFNSLNWFETIAPMFAPNTDAFNRVKSSIDQAMAIRTGPYRYTAREVIDTTITGAPIMGNVTREHYEYGEAVLNWLNSSGGPQQYQMRSVNSPQNFEDKVPESSGCVRENTPIRMADGSVKPIQDVVPGDFVLNGMGTFSVCSKEKIYNPYVQEMYSINDEPVFMSAEHALMTNRGWCSLNPYLSRQINPELKINKLEVGDQVWKFKSFEGGALAFQKIQVVKINVERTAAEGFIGYDLHFTEGYDSYFARDYLCLLNYPEITMARVLDNIKNKMSPSEEMRFIQMIRENDLLFRKVFGNEAMDMLNLNISQL